MRLVLLSFWHVHAADYARDAAEHPDTEIAVVWDAQPERGRVEAAARNLEFSPDLDAILADASIDGVIVTTETTAHSELIPKIAAAGKHLFIEKVIAPTLRESLEIVDAVRSAGVIMSVALTRAILPSTTKMLALIAEGGIGQPTSSRVRIAHDGALPTPDRPDGWLPVRFFDQAESGGGAMIDLGAHPLYLTRLFLGMPDRVTALYGDVTARGADDNAIALFGFDNGAIGIAETGFVSGARNSGFEVNGTDASLTHELGADHLLLRRRGAEPERIALPPDGPNSFSRWVSAVQSGQPDQANLTFSLELSALHEAVSKSAAERRVVDLIDIDGWDRTAPHRDAQE